MANLGNGVSYVTEEQGYNNSLIVFQKGKPPLDTELNAIQQIQNIINQKQLNNLPSGWMSLRDFYTKESLVNKFYTQDPSNAIPEYALVNGNVIYVTNTGTSEENSNLIDLGIPPITGNKVNGIYLEVWRALLDPANNVNKPDPSLVIDSIHGIYMFDTNYGWVVGDSGLILGTQDGGQIWSVQAIDTKRKLSGVIFITNKIGWVVGDNGVIAKTSTGGLSWVLVQTSTQENLNSVHFISNLVGWTVGDSGTILKTTNGTTWVAQSSGITRNLNKVYFYDALTGWAVGDQGTIIKTTNGGTTWSSKTSNTTVNLRSVKFYDLNFGWAVGDSGVVLRTSDGGSSWVSQSNNLIEESEYSTITANLSDISIAPNLDVYSDGEEVSSQFNGSNKNFSVLNAPITNGNGKGEVTNNPIYVRVKVNNVEVLVDSVDGINGDVVLNAAPGLNDVVKVYYNHLCDNQGSFSGYVWICGDTGTVLMSDDLGATWTSQNPSTSYNLNGIYFTNKSRGWAVGDVSIIRTTSNSGSTWTAQQENTIVREVQRVYKEGNIGTVEYLNDESVHPDVNIETTKRVQIQYKIRIADNVDPFYYPESGLGSSVIVGLGPNSTGQHAFENMGPETGDYGLWRAICPGTVDGYCWAIPMFFVNRRNSTAYNYFNNANGSHRIDTGFIRPDLLTAEEISPVDILDVRRRVILPPVSSLLSENLDSLLSNNLITKIFRDTNGGDKYGTKILHTDRIGGVDSDGGVEISDDLSDAIDGTISSEVTMTLTTVVSTDIDSVPTTPIDLGPVTGLFHINPSYYSATYNSDSTEYNGKPIPGYFTGYGTNNVTFTFSTSANNSTDDPNLISYVITGYYYGTSSTSLTHIPSDPKLIKNISGSGDPSFYYQGVLDTVTKKTLEQWDSGIPSYMNSSEVYSTKIYTDTDQKNRASNVLVKFYQKISSENTDGQNILIIDDEILDGSPSSFYKIFTIHKVRNVNFSYKIKNIYESGDKIYIESLDGFPFTTDTIVEITAAVLSNDERVNIRNGASANFTPNIKKVSSFCSSYIPTVSVGDGVYSFDITIPNGTLLGVSTTETADSLEQPYCILNDAMRPISVTGFGTSTVSVTILDSGSYPILAGSVYIQLLILEDELTYSSSASNDGLLISYYYTPYQSVKSLPSSLTLGMMTQPDNIYISNLGTGGGTTGSPYSIPLDHIPVADPAIINEEYFHNSDLIRFNNFKIDTGFVEMPVVVPGSLNNYLILSVPKYDISQRYYYSSVSPNFTFETEALSVGVPRKIFIACIGLVKESSDYLLIKGEYVLVIFSRVTSVDKENYTGFIDGLNTVSAIYRLPNKPTIRI